MSVPTPFPLTVQAVVLETILIGLAVLFLPGAGGDMVAARQAASQMLAAYNPQNDDELRLAAIVTSFSFRALEALGQAATPDLSISRVLRLSGSAVSLSREAAKAERRLTQLQKARHQEIQAQEPTPKRVKTEPRPFAPAIQSPANQLPVVRPSLVHPPFVQPPVVKSTIGSQPKSVNQPAGKIAAQAKAKGISWTQAYDEHQRDLRIAASVAKAEAKFSPRVAAAIRADVAGNPKMARSL